MERQNIKTIIFDLGGVIIDLDVSATVAAFSMLLNKSTHQIHSLMANEDLFIDYEKGLISSEAFREGVRQLAEKYFESNEIDDAWNAMLGDIPHRRLQLLNDLRSSYQVMILSNTNEIHEKAFHQILEKVSGKPHLSYFADKVYFSHQLKMRKPDIEIYEYVLENNGLNAGETLFLDDKLENLLGAQSCGIATMHITHPDQIFTLQP